MHHRVGVGLLGLLLAASLAAGAPCSMDVIGHKYEAFAQRQLALRATRSRKESAQGERVRDIMAAAEPAPIRIKLITQLQGTFLEPAQAKRLAEQLGPGAVAIINKFVQVRLPRRYAIRQPRPADPARDGFCNDAWAGVLWENGGVRDADLVLFLTANKTKDCKAGALAYTLPCLTDMLTGRPVAAGMNICPLSQKSSPKRLLNTIVHEMVHALGFSGQLFPLYYDDRSWNPYRKVEQVAVEFQGANRTSPSSMYISFPAMKALARRYYACDSLPGAPADVGSFASHFKQRVMGHELMMPATSEDGQSKQVTEFTLTLLDATGWYKTRLDLAQPATFGRGAGCALLQDTCSAYIEANPLQNYYCPAEREEGDQCTFDYKGIGVCVEGVDDGCLLAGASSLRGSTLTCGSSSSWSTMRHQAFYYHHAAFGGTVGSPSARCFALQGSVKACRKSGKDAVCLMRRAMCLDARCDSKGNVEAVFRFDEDGSSVALPCPTGGSIDLAQQLPGRGFISGKLRCPPASAICPGLSCKQPCVNGVCYEGRCRCDMEWVGERCEKNLVPGPSI